MGGMLPAALAIRPPRGSTTEAISRVGSGEGLRPTVGILQRLMDLNGVLLPLLPRELNGTCGEYHRRLLRPLPPAWALAPIDAIGL